jgi:hypothetical protein
MENDSLTFEQRDGENAFVRKRKIVNVLKKLLIFVKTVLNLLTVVFKFSFIDLNNNIQVIEACFWRIFFPRIQKIFR